MKVRGLSTIVVIFAVCAFGMVFKGCSDVSGDEGEKQDLRLTPTVADFVIENLSQIKENITDVTIRPKPGRSNGEISIYYNESTELPTAYGAYAVTFDVEETADWKAASGLAAGTLTVSDIVIGDIPELRAYLSSQTANNKNTPYCIAINIDDEKDFASLRTTLNSSNKYVYLDLSGSTITTIPARAFYGESKPWGCDTLAGITIPNSVFEIEGLAFNSCENLASVTIGNKVTSIGNQAFQDCASLTSITIPDRVAGIAGQAFRGTSLTSVTFQGTIPYKYFIDNMTFPGGIKPYPNDLREKFYADDRDNGTPGTYTRSASESDSSEWERQATN